MARGIPYDSEQGRQIAAAITALMTGPAYTTSAEIASGTGPFRGFAPNREPMLGVIGPAPERRREDRSVALCRRCLLAEARKVWDEPWSWVSGGDSATPR